MKKTTKNKILTAIAMIILPYGVTGYLIYKAFKFLKDKKGKKNERDQAKGDGEHKSRDKELSSL